MRRRNDGHKTRQDAISSVKNSDAYNNKKHPKTMSALRNLPLTYKESYPNDDWNDPYADPTNGLSDYDDIESDESDSDHQE